MYDKSGILYCAKCAKSIEKRRVAEQRDKEAAERRNLLLTREEYARFEVEPVLSSAMAETWEDFKGGLPPEFEVLKTAGRDSEDEKRRVVRLVYTRAARKAYLERTYWKILIGIVLVSSVGWGFLSIAGAIIWFVGMMAFILVAQSTSKTETGYRRVEEQAQQWLIRTREDPKKGIAQTLTDRRSAREYFAALSPRDFEQEVGEAFAAYGYQITVTPFVGDEGVDLVLEDEEGMKSVVQIKRYTRGLSVGRPDLQKLQGAMLNAKTARGIFVTLSNFSEPARRYARSHGIRLIDGDELIEMWLEIQKKDWDDVNGTTR